MNTSQTASDDPHLDRSGPLFDRVSGALEAIRVEMQKDGGDIELLAVEDAAIAIVEVKGKCSGCPMSEISVRYGLEGHLRGSVPEIITVDIVNRSQPVKDATFTDVLEAAVIVPDTPRE